MKNRFKMLARTGVLTMAVAALTGCPEAAESQSVNTTPAANPATTVATPAPTNDADIAVTNAVAGDIREQLPPAVPPMSPGLNDVVRLAQSKMGDDVLLAYIARSGAAYNPTTEELVFLHDLGISDKVIAEILRRSPQSMAAKDQKPTEPLNIPVVNAPKQTAATNIPVAAAPAPVAVTNPASVVATPAAAPVQVVQQPVIVEQPIVIQQAPQEVQYFYSSLSPYGSWVEVDGYGWCWQPTIAVTYTDWRPYQQGGRWIYSDCGWYWQSDYSWGWAPFHYGRWFNHPRRGWCWVPDRVWGPSWVSWRSSTSYCGWAPLPPAARYRSGFGLSYYDRSVGVSFEFGLGAVDYTFVSINHFYDHNPYQHRLPHSQVTRVYNQTTVNNVIVQGNNNNVVINNGGVAVSQVSRATRTEVQKVAVMDAPAQRSGVQPDRLVRDNGMLAVYRPSGPGSSSSAKFSSEPVKGQVATAPAARPSNNGPGEKRNHAPAPLPINNNATAASTPAPAAPNTAMQRYEPPKSTELPVLKRPDTFRSSSPYQPAVNNNNVTTAGPVQPASPNTTIRGTGYTAPSKNAPEANRPMSTPKPVYGAAAQPSFGQPVQPATPEQSRLSAPQPVTSYQAPPTQAIRNEPTKPTVNTRPNYTNPRTYNPENNTTVNTPRVSTQEIAPQTAQTPVYSSPTPTYNKPTPTYSAPTPTYTAPTPTMNRPTPTYNAPTPTYNRPAPTYSAPTPTYTPPVQNSRPVYTAPATVTPQAPAQRTYEAPRPSYSAPASPAVSSPAPVVRPAAPQSSPAPSQGGGRGNDNRNDDNGNRRPGR